MSNNVSSSTDELIMLTNTVKKVAATRFAKLKISAGNLHYPVCSPLAHSLAANRCLDYPLI